MPRFLLLSVLLAAACSPPPSAATSVHHSHADADLPPDSQFRFDDETFEDALERSLGTLSTSSLRDAQVNPYSPLSERVPMGGIDQSVIPDWTQEQLAANFTVARDTRVLTSATHPEL